MNVVIRKILGRGNGCIFKSRVRLYSFRKIDRSFSPINARLWIIAYCLSIMAFLIREYFENDLKIVFEFEITPKTMRPNNSNIKTLTNRSKVERATIKDTKVAIEKGNINDNNIISNSKGGKSWNMNGKIHSIWKSTDIFFNLKPFSPFLWTKNCI